MQDNLLMLGADEMVDDVGSRCVSTGVAEPFRAYEALNDRWRRMDAAIAR